MCKDAFCQLHAIGKYRIEIVTAKLALGVFCSGYNCGLHDNRPHAIPDEIKAQVNTLNRFQTTRVITPVRII